MAKRPKDEVTPFARFRNLISGIVAVPKKGSKLKRRSGAKLDG
jgi:hypothetical protein